MKENTLQGNARQTRTATLSMLVNY